MKVGYHQIYTWREETPEEYKAFHTLFRRGASPVFIDRLKHPNDECPSLKRLIERIKPNDTVYTWTLKYLGNTLDKLTKTVRQIEEKEAKLVLIKEDIDFTLLAHTTVSDIIALYKTITFEFRQKNTLDGLDRARQVGNIGGRPISDGTGHKEIAAERLYLNTDISSSQIAASLKISKATLYKYLRRRGIKIMK